MPLSSRRNKRLLPSLSLNHISLYLVGLMWVWPFLHNIHRYPITSFYQEWWAAALGLCAMTALLATNYWRQPEIPRIILLPIGMLLLILAQFALGKIYYFDQALLYTLYLLWAALLVMLGRQLRAEFGLPVMAVTLAGFLLAGTELSALAGVLQHYRLHSFLDAAIALKKSAAVFGNLGQPNHFADYITLGLVSLGLLASHWKLRVWQTTVLAAPLLFVLVLSGSRAPWLYLLCLAGLAYVWQRREVSCRPLLYFSLLMLAGFGLMHLAVLIPWLAGPGSTVTSLDRMSSNGIASFATGGDIAIRLNIWREAGLMLAQFPMLGIGFGQFAWHHFLLGPSLGSMHLTGMYNNAHNLVMQLAAETGLSGLLIFAATLSPLAWRISKAPRTPYLWWGCGLLVVVGVHSLLEYPLWYAYFLGIAAVTLGVLDTGNYRLKLRNLGRLSVAVVLLLGVLSLTQVWDGYRKLEAVLALRPASETDAVYVSRMRDGFVEAQQQALLRPYAELFMSSLIDASEDHLAEKLDLNERAMHFVPASEVVYREVLLLALAGKQAEAQQQLQLAAWSFPGDFPAALDNLRGMARKDPAHFDALLKFAAEKIKER
jgi:O-antigen ligase